MATKISLKKSSVEGKVPLATDLEVGELAVNLADGKLYSKNTSNVVITVGGDGGSGGGAVNGSFYESYSTIITDYTVATDKNSMVAGPITINDGVTVTIPDGSTLVVV